ncbi:hypothetical protein RIF29_00697 [Crotalaria pallida]|uniref:Uncharacterized protein n=1 Tax=Crotalaria pallida TaxID=3830 RepID=A0AAN9IW42_CROPI
MQVVLEFSIDKPPQFEDYTSYPFKLSLIHLPLSLISLLLCLCVRCRGHPSKKSSIHGSSFEKVYVEGQGRST